MRGPTGVHGIKYLLETAAEVIPEPGVKEE
jgi:hypothetical protein